MANIPNFSDKDFRNE